jgi:hypothetical protein
MVIVIFLPGGLVEGSQKIMTVFTRKKGDDEKSEPGSTAVSPAE